MSRDRDQGRAPSPWTGYYNQNQQQNGGTSNPLAVSTDISQQGRNPISAPPTSSPRLPDRPDMPTRSSTTGSSNADRNLTTNNNPYPQSRSEDLNHHTSNYNSVLSSSPRPSPPFLSSGGTSSRPNTPGTQSREPSSSGHSDHSGNHTSATTHSSEVSSSNPKPPSSTSSTSTSLSST